MIMKLGYLFQIPSTKPVWNAPSGEITMTSFRLAIKPRYLGNHASQMESYYGTLSGNHSHFFRMRHEKSREASLLEKSGWSHIRLAIKPRYLVNHASQIKSYYGTLSGSHGRSFRIRHEEWPETPPGAEITMTSYPACNKTSLSRKPCIPDKNLLWITNRKSCSLFQDASWKIAWSAPWWRIDDDVMSGWQ